MENIFNKYKNGEISRFEAYKLIGEEIGLDTSKVQSVYEKYFKPSEENCLENINQACETYTTYNEYEEEAFIKFMYGLSKDKEKIREVKRLSSTV